MGEGAFDPKGFSGIVPLFPLPNVVLFPGMFLPLHIFEPRYREMMADALQGERLIAMALLRPGRQEDEEGSPAIHEILGLGKIVEHSKLPDGRYNLVLYGLARVRLMKEVGFGAYRTAQVEILDDAPPKAKSGERRRRILLELYTEAIKVLTKGGLPVPPDDVPLGMLCDLLASLLVRDTNMKQRLLEELDVDARSDKLLERLGIDDAPPIVPPRPRPWPEGPSLN